MSQEFEEFLETKRITEEMWEQTYCKHKCENKKQLNEFYSICCICRDIDEKCSGCLTFLTEISCRNCSSKKVCKYLPNIRTSIAPFINGNITINYFPNEHQYQIEEFLKLFAGNCQYFKQKW